ncbi:MAG TPA: class I SAM-dependent methyltransferase [Vicinamibacteria bacterium]|nr:class I SAM-dependent methyltransferase [Vicinamibacteria bacterium]
MIPKPAHLGPRYAAQFEDESVARAYHTRPPYPDALFDILEGLMPPGPRTVLDLGCGTGDLAVGFVGRAERIDAVDPSRAMLQVARYRHPSGRLGLHWVESTAEAYRPDRRYSVIVAAESLHWMEWQDVLSWIPRALAPEAALALVSGRELGPLPWSRELSELLPAFSTNREYRPYDLVEELEARSLFCERGRASTAPVACAQPVDDYVESFHTRNGFSRERMAASAAEAFDDALRRLVAPHCPDGWIRSETAATVVWGLPRERTMRGGCT